MERERTASSSEANNLVWFGSNDREKLGIDRYMRRRHMNHQATIRRGHISEDGFSELYNLGPLMKGTIQIRFIDEYV